MTTLAEVFLDGVAISAVYALIALGFTVVYKASGVVNFAHGSFLLLGGYLVARWHGTLGFGGALLAAAAATGAVAVLIYALAARRLGSTGSTAVTILTIGVDVIMSTDLARRIGGDYLSLGDPWGGTVLHLGALTIPETRIAAICVAGIAIGGVFAALKWSAWGLSVRAIGSDEEAAALMGIRLRRVRSASWAMAGGLAVLAAVFLAGFPAPGLAGTTGEVALAAFPAAIIGGMDSAGGALLGSLLVGMTQAFAAGYQNSLSSLGTNFGAVAPYLVMVAVLLARPSGLLGSKEATRV
jgi:branched-chain amino acid transport system permease protein